MMLVETLLTLFTIQGLCSETFGMRRSRILTDDETAAVVDDFPWDLFEDKSGIDPMRYLGHLAARSIETLACTTV